MEQITLTKTRINILKYANGEIDHRPASDSTFRLMEKSGFIHWVGWVQGIHSADEKMTMGQEMKDGRRLTPKGKKTLNQNKSIGTLNDR